MAATVPGMPPAATPVVDSLGNFQKTWFLFLSALTQYLGSSGTGGTPTSTSGLNVIPIAGGHVSPNLSLGVIQYVLLTANAILDAPAGTGPAIWILVIDQDATGNWTLSPDPTYAVNFALVSGPSTRIQISWLLDAAGNDSICGAPSTGQPIP